jgi:hypothetical protein
MAMSAAGVVERWRRDGIGMVTATLAGMTTLTAAHVLAPGGVAEIARGATDIGLWLTALVVTIAFAAAGLSGGNDPRYVDDNKARCAVRRPSVWYSLARRPS